MVARCDDVQYQQTPTWVKQVNAALETCPVATVLAFVLIDIGSACTLLAALVALKVNVPSDFVLAYAICKGALRVPRLALDASGAALLARRWPSLAAVRVSLMIDAAARAVKAVQCMLDTLLSW